jgi:regulator of sigma E protease
MYLIGVQSVKPVVGEVRENSFAQAGGLQTGDRILSIAGRETLDWEAVNYELISHIGDQTLNLRVERSSGVPQSLTFQIDTWQFDPEQESALGSLGIVPFRPAVTLDVAQIGEDSPASRSGLLVGDTIEKMGSESIESWAQMVDVIINNPGESISLTVNREGRQQILVVTLDSVMTEQGETRGYLGMSPRVEPWPEDIVFIHQYGIFDGFSQALDRTWRLMTLSVEMIGKLLTGDVSVKNLSGPISIAQGAGASADYGFVYFLSFLALISVKLGIINLLPLPMLDGGHLMYFTIEWLTGKPVSEAVQEIGYKVGGILLLTLMGIALFNDFARLA